MFLTDLAIEKASLPSVNIENCTARHAVLNATHIKSVCHICDLENKSRVDL